MHRNS